MIASRYPSPVHETIVEPFAGSAGYGVRHYGRKVILADLNPQIAGVWEYLIRTSSDEIAKLPLLMPGQSVSDLSVCQEAKWLIGWWVNKGVAEPHLRLSAWAREPRYASQFWGTKIRERLSLQVNYIRHWRIFHADYREVDSIVPTDEVTWFIDPPYQASPGRRYPYNQIDYAELARWCVGRRGQVIVCENGKASWLPFREIGDTYSTIARRSPEREISREAVWVNGFGSREPSKSLSETAHRAPSVPMRSASPGEVPRGAVRMLDMARRAAWRVTGVTYARGFTPITRAGVVSREVESVAVRLLAGDGTRIAMVWWGGRIETVLIRDECGMRKTDLTTAGFVIQSKADVNRASRTAASTDATAYNPDEGDDMPRILHTPPTDSKTIEPRTYTVAPIDWSKHADGTWREFAQGTPHEVQNGTADFVGKPETVAAGVRRWAKAHGSTGRISVTENSVKVQLTPPTHPNGDALKPKAAKATSQIEVPAEMRSETFVAPERAERLAEPVDPFALSERF